MRDKQVTEIAESGPSINFPIISIVDRKQDKQETAVAEFGTVKTHVIYQKIPHNVHRRSKSWKT